MPRFTFMPLAIIDWLWSICLYAVANCYTCFVCVCASVVRDRCKCVQWTKKTDRAKVNPNKNCYVLICVNRWTYSSLVQLQISWINKLINKILARVQSNFRIVMRCVSSPLHNSTFETPVQFSRRYVFCVRFVCWKLIITTDRGKNVATEKKWRLKNWRTTKKKRKNKYWKNKKRGWKLHGISLLLVRGEGTSRPKKPSQKIWIDSILEMHEYTSRSIFSY